MRQVIDNFSKGGSDYATYRPESPDSIYDFLYQHIDHFDIAWDCGTGNGQVAARLAGRFKKVYGTDVSKDQLHHAIRKNNIFYLVERAEETSFPDRSIDFIAIAQAIHWFDFSVFYKEVKRVARPGALIAAWTYNLLQMTPALNEVIGHFYYDITRPYWDKERDYVDAGYQTIPFPFNEIQSPAFQINKKYSLKQLIGYIRTWSGVKHYIEQEHRDPVEFIEADLQKAWGDAALHDVTWPMFMRLGKVGG